MPLQLQLKVNFDPTFYKEEKVYTTKVLNLMKGAINSHAFSNRVLNYEGKSGNQFNGISGLDVLDTIRNAEEIKAVPGTKRVIDLKLRLVNGYSKLSHGEFDHYSGKIITYRGNFKKMSAAGLAGHFAHEWCHSLGYEHPNNSMDSVPFAIGHLVEKLASSPNQLHALS